MALFCPIDPTYLQEEKQTHTVHTMTRDCSGLHPGVNVPMTLPSVEPHLSC